MCQKGLTVSFDRSSDRFECLVEYCVLDYKGA